MAIISNLLTSLFLATTALAIPVPSAPAAGSNTVTFISTDSTPRTIVFTSDVGLASIEPAHVGAHESVTVSFPTGWIGNWWSVSEGAPSDVPGMLGEVTFQGWEGSTYFDVSAIVNPDDHDGVKELYPVASRTPTSGCKTFPCDNAYYLWDDVQTRVTKETALVCTLGNGDAPAVDDHDQSREYRRDAGAPAALGRVFVAGGH